MNLLVLAVVLAILAKLVVILKLGLRNIYTLHSTATCFDSYNSLSFTIIGKGNCKFDLKIKEALRINWKKPKLNAQLNPLSLILLL